MSITFTNPRTGRSVSSELRRPFVVVEHGRIGARCFGSLEAARAAVRGASSLFFDTEPGCGSFIERRP